MIDIINEIRLKLDILPNHHEREKGVKDINGFCWGYPDGADALANQWTMYYEIEAGQRHPCTNVLKYWPLLELDSYRKIILIQWFVEKSRDLNRFELSKFVARKLMAEFDSRFHYYLLEGPLEKNYDTILSIKQALLKIGITGS